MVNIPAPADKIPMMFRAQTKGRCQLQFIAQDRKQDSEIWVEEWIEETYSHPPQFGEEVNTKTYTFNWRFVTNGGQDEGIIRPVMGAFGIPFYPGSSMKGAFCQACTPEQKQKYKLNKNGDEPSLLRFHGGYPINDWTEKLLDIVHPQQTWQVKTPDTKTKPGGESGFAMISLYQPEFKFGISSHIDNTDWPEIWTIWEKALGYGIGCRVSSGYGLANSVKPSAKLLCKFYLKGQGQAAKTINNAGGEFRPNIFRGALRGHAMRVIGGLTDAQTAQNLVNILFGGIEGEAQQGLLGLAFQESFLELGIFNGGYAEPTYKVTGELRWLLTQSLSPEEKEHLQLFINLLMGFSMLLGGFGKSWRRADHRLFYEQYYDDKKPLIGCHWQWNDDSLIKWGFIRKLDQVTTFLDHVQKAATAWMQCRGITPHPEKHAHWREVWHPENVQVWGRLAEDQEDSLAIAWLHQPYQKGDPAGTRARVRYQSQLTIKQSPLTGKISQVGKIWLRMYPVLGKSKETGQYLELLTIFRDDCQQYQDFTKFLQSRPTFQLLWGNPS